MPIFTNQSFKEIRGEVVEELLRETDRLKWSVESKLRIFGETVQRRKYISLPLRNLTIKFRRNGDKIWNFSAVA